MNTTSLEGNTALITGAAGLLGIQHADALLEAGANLILTDSNSESLKLAVESLTRKYPLAVIIPCVMDVTQEKSILEIAQELELSDNLPDILINNAAIDHKVSSQSSSIEFSRLENYSIESWDHEIAVGLKGAFLCAKIFGSKIVERQQKGVILNIASDLSVIAPNQNLYVKKGLEISQQPVKPVTYSVIKTGLIGLTRYLATYWGNRGLRCNALSPGGVYNSQPQEFVRRIEKLIPMGRMAHESEYRQAIVFLCSDASSYMNGQNIVIDGGRSVW